MAELAHTRDEQNKLKKGELMLKKLDILFKDTKFIKSLSLI